MPTIPELDSRAQADINPSTFVLPGVQDPAVTNKVTTQALVNAALAAVTPQGGTMALTGAMSISTSLTVSGAATIGGGLAVTGSISATGQVAASAFATTGYNASTYSAKLLLAGSATTDNFATFIATNGAGRTYYMGPGVGDGQVASFALYDNTLGAARWRSTASGFDVTGSISATAGVEGADFRAYTADNAAGGAGVNTASVAFANGGTVKARIRSAVYGDGYMAFHVNDDTEQMRLTNGGLAVTGSISASTRVNYPSYTVATLPAVGSAGGNIYVSDESGGAQPAFSDGTNWRRYTDRAIVS